MQGEGAVTAAVADPSGMVVSRTITAEAEEYSSSVAGVDIEAVRAGPGGGLSDVLAATNHRFTFTASKVGFPMLSWATIPDDLFVVAYIRSTPPGSRWCEIDLEPGDVLAYAAGAEHTARNLAGTDFMFAMVSHEQLAAQADQLETRVVPQPRGEVHLLARTEKADLLGERFLTFANAAVAGAHPPLAITEGLLAAVTTALSEERRLRQIGRLRRIDCRNVVHRCIDYATSIQRIPSIDELCLAAQVSERTLRVAFVREFDVPPSMFFKAWALELAHNRLRKHTCDQSVTDVAVGIGFAHLGRFAASYRGLYGEAPSTTLRSCE